jgi:Uma2 family endonuclease
VNQAAAAAAVPFDDYFASEVACADGAPKHEWFDGVVYAMSRGTPEHGRLTARVTVALGNALPDDCQIYSSDTMLFIASASLATYADAIIVCGPLETLTVRDKNGRSVGQAVTNPVVVVEVLSESTERYDRDGKFQAYKQLPSLREYVLVSQDVRRIEVFRRADGWVGEVGAASESVRIHGAAIDVDRVYGPG